ncbi:MAG TPA: SLBB domain-containing protein [Candidatus Competibacteraceae bacterium]|nr:SLBB domain-containing protein [Candidatus Competibacteraceae bacterium]
MIIFRWPSFCFPGRLIKRYFILLMATGLLLVIHLTHAQQLPLLESLSEQQRIQQMKAAPSGEDEPIQAPVIAPVIPAPVSPVEEQPSAIEQNVTETLNTITLEDKIRKQVVQPELQQFGYDLFQEVPTTFAPVTDLPVPPDYIIGPGDTLVVQVYGKLNVEYRLVVTRDGRLLVPELGPLQVGGMRFDEASELLRERFDQQIVGAKAVTTLGALRTIRVLVVGDVVKPGDYTVSGLTTLLNTLMSTGGVKRTGTLRNIELKRAGQKIASLDLYDILLQGDTSGDVQLQHGDVIFVPSIGPTVGIAGEIQRPAIYELRDQSTVKDVITLAGGLLPTASLADAHIERIEDGNRYTLVDAPLNTVKGLSLQVAEGDIIRVFPITRAMDDVVLLSGHVLRPGGFQFRKGMRVSDLLPSSRILRPNADTSYGLLRRENPKTRRIQVRYLDIESIFRHPGGPSDPLLAARDEVIVFDLNEARAQHLAGLARNLRTQAEPGRYPPMLVEVKGHARYTGTLPLAAGVRLLDVLGLAGGALPGSDTDYGLVARQSHTNGRLEFLAFSLNRARQAPDTTDNLLIFPEDTIYLFAYEGERTGLITKDMDRMVQQTPYGQAAPVIFVRGEVRHPGRYPLEPGMRVDGLLRAGGGLLEEAYGLSAELTRYELLEGEYRVADHRQIDLADVIADESGGLILQPHDELVLHRKPNWREKASVTLRGEVRFPGEYPIQQGDTLCQVIQRAGGLTGGAYPFGSVFIRDRVRQQQQQALDRIQGNLDDLLVNLSLSHGVDNADKTPAGERRQELIKVINQLKKAEAMGRMVIDLKRAMECDAEANIVLQDGDKLSIPPLLDEVTVVGEVYYPSSHLYRKSLNSADYVALSGGTTVLAREDHIFVVQANGEIVSVRGGDWKNRAGDVAITPGATIYVPLNVDRMNRLEFAQSWTKILYHLGITAASLDSVGVFK